MLLCLDGSWRPRIAGEAVFEAAADLAFQGSRLWVYRAQRSGFMGRDLNPRLWELEGSGFRVEGSRVREREGAGSKVAPKHSTVGFRSHQWDQSPGNVSEVPRLEVQRNCSGLSETLRYIPLSS